MSLERELLCMCPQDSLPETYSSLTVKTDETLPVRDADISLWPEGWQFCPQDGVHKTCPSLTGNAGEVLSVLDATMQDGMPESYSLLAGKTCEAQPVHYYGGSSYVIGA